MSQATKYAIVISSESSFNMAQTISRELNSAEIITRATISGATHVDSLSKWVADSFANFDGFVFIGAMGIAVRCIAPHIVSKDSDPAIVNIDSEGQFVVSLLSGHVGGANSLTERVAHIIGATPVISTRSDCTNNWALDTMGASFGWKVSYRDLSLNKPIATLVNGGSTALLLDVRDRGTDELERTKPANVTIFYKFEDIDQSQFELIIAVTPRVYSDAKTDIIYYHPAILHLGVGCRKDASADGVAQHIDGYLRAESISPLSLASISTIEIKRDEKLVADVKNHFSLSTLNIYSADDLSEVEVLNPSARVEQATGVASVSESSALLSASRASSNCNAALVVEKQKGSSNNSDNNFTFAVAIERGALRGGHIEIVGAGPGDPDLVSVRGRQMLQRADLILYAGSLVPIELTHCAKVGAVVRSSADMNLEEQFEIMKEFYDRGLFVVRLHTGDPCIYGAIQEQMAFFDQYNMSYHITPGISSFQAAAAALRSQFTIPDRIQTIILTRGEGRTAMPPKEKLSLLARSQSTMCIFLSASIVDKVQTDLLEHYPPTTPVAACYKLTWRDEKIFRGELKDLAHIVKSNNLTLTTMIVVGDSIDNRQGLSKLYDDSFKHLFRK
ncbi:MAG: precorrin-4 C(11)-methyltransferase [Rikenellaceae bacterium]